MYQDYYETSFLLSETPSTISWIGTIQGFILAIAGSITGPIYDRDYFRYLIFTGTFLVTLGTRITSLCSSYYQLVLAQGVCVGLGAACFWVPSVAILATYFDSKRNLMTAIAVAGSSIGDRYIRSLESSCLPLLQELSSIRSYSAACNRLLALDGQHALLVL